MTERVMLRGESYVTTTAIGRELGLGVSGDRLRGLGFVPHEVGNALLWRESDLGRMYAALAMEIVRKAEARG